MVNKRTKTAWWNPLSHVCPINKHHITITVAQLIVVILALQATLAYSHGYVTYPKARQQFCVDDGGYWWPEDGSGIPNAACRAAFLASGTFPFVQNIEFSSNVADYLNINAVKAVVTDGNLCSAGDIAKSGMNIASAHWQKTRVSPDQFGNIEFQFFASTPHNPSFWEFYLTKPGFNTATQPLHWNDLDLIDTADNVEIVSINALPMYQITVKLPAGRTGDAIFFSRWQRVDAAGEGFYNCSDITFSDSTPVEWHDNGYYISQGSVGEVDDEVWFRVFNNVGDEVVFEKMAITTTNQSTSMWAQQLATRINQQQGANVKIGVKNSAGIIEYSSSSLLANKVWLSYVNYSFALEIKKSQTNLPPVVQLPATYQVAANTSLNIIATATDPENQPLSYQWTLPTGVTASITNNTNITVQAGNPAQTSDYVLSLNVSDGQNTVSAQTTLSVLVGNSNCQAIDANAGNYPAWVLGNTYTSGTEVSHNQLIWSANSWTNSEEPSMVSVIWALISNVNISWQLGMTNIAGDEVDHSGRRWEAMWWNRDEPGTSRVWKDIGPAHCP